MARDWNAHTDARREKKHNDVRGGANTEGTCSQLPEEWSVNGYECVFIFNVTQRQLGAVLAAHCPQLLLYGHI